MQHLLLCALRVMSLDICTLESGIEIPVKNSCSISSSIIQTELTHFSLSLIAAGRRITPKLETDYSQLVGVLMLPTQSMGGGIIFYFFHC